ncbi:MAG: hypothetical protein AAF544_06990 [Bacteroidota bacterium]
MRLPILIISCLLPLLVGAQVEYLRLSPGQQITQRIGATDVELAFSRPQMKGSWSWKRLKKFRRC